MYLDLRGLIIVARLPMLMSACGGLWDLVLNSLFAFCQSTRVTAVYHGMIPPSFGLPPGEPPRRLVKSFAELRSVSIVSLSGKVELVKHVRIFSMFLLSLSLGQFLKVVLFYFPESYKTCLNFNIYLLLLV